MLDESIGGERDVVYKRLNLYCVGTFRCESLITVSSLAYRRNQMCVTGIDNTELIKMCFMITMCLEKVLSKEVLFM